MATEALIEPAHGRANNYRHGHKSGAGGSREWAAYNNMRARCYNPKNNRYHRYGARGIKVCERWLAGFTNFLEDMGRVPGPEYSLERVDNDKDYGPDNCRWATRKEQANNRASSKLLEFKGQSKTQAQWADELEIPASTLHARLATGWTVDRALSTPLRGQNRH